MASEVTTLQTHIWKPLDGPDEIRLLELLPQASSEIAIDCRLHHTSLRSRENIFVAISYAWGDDKPEQRLSITCDGASTRITPNLYSTLARIQHLNLAGLIWVDALCINQSNDSAALQERARQVQMMDQIFSAAAGVIVDLGKMVRSSELDVLRVLDCYQAIPNDVWVDADPLTAQSPVQTCLAKLARFELPKPDSPFWAGFAQLLCRPWFTRAWIIQEYALAKRIRILYGRQVRDHNFLCDGVGRPWQYLTWLYIADRYYPAGGQHCDALSQAWWTVGTKWNALEKIVNTRAKLSDHVTLCDLLESTSKLFDASDTRDKVYSIRGLIADGDVRSKILVDYQESLQELTIRVSRLLISLGHGPYVLANGLGLRCTEESMSWALNLHNTKRDGFSNFVSPQGICKDGYFKPCGNSRFQYKFSDQQSSLMVSTFLFDSMVSLSRNLPSIPEIERAKVSSFNGVLVQMFQWMIDNLHLRPDLSPEDFRRQCWCTLAADRIVASGEEGKDSQRLHAWEHADRCLNAIDLGMHVGYKKATGKMPTSEFIPYDGVIRQDMNVYATGWELATGRRLGITCGKTTGKCFFVLVPAETELGDRICFIPGSPLPMVLRRQEQPWYQLVGTCYVHEMMDGQALELENWKLEEIELR